MLSKLNFVLFITILSAIAYSMWKDVQKDDCYSFRDHGTFITMLCEIEGEVKEFSIIEGAPSKFIGKGFDV